jgi:endoglucanase
VQSRKSHPALSGDRAAGGRPWTSARRQKARKAPTPHPTSDPESKPLAPKSNFESRLFENGNPACPRNLGFSIIRLAFDSAKVQRANLQPLNQSELRNITRLVEYARKSGLYIILDPHNYGAMWSNDANDFQLIGVSPYIPHSYFADFWRRLATIYQNYPNVIYGLMNEPNKQTPKQWKASAVAAIKAIRQVSTTQTILIPGSSWTTAATWVTSGNAAAWTGYSDPAGGPFLFEMHQYLDSDYSGTHDTCASGYGSDVLTDATDWLGKNGYQALIGEFGWRSVQGVVSPTCQTEGTALLDAMNFSRGQWAGWVWCCSGPWARDNGVNLYNIDLNPPKVAPQTTTLLNYIP